MKDERSPERPVPIYRQIPLAFLLAPIILRILPMGNAFWLDEIWSWQISRVVTSPLQILTNPLAQSDNNHPLNTLWMYLVGDTGNWWMYRIPALLAGCASVLIVLLNERRDRFTALAVSLLLGLSFPLITYSTEARGYALALLCAVVGYYLLRSDRSRPIAFAIVCVAGLLCHLIFLHFLMAAGVWVIAQGKWRRLWFFAVPLIALMAYGWIFVRHVHVGGAPDTSMLGTIAASFSLLLGGAMDGNGIFPAACVALMSIAAALLWLYRQNRAEAIFFFYVIFLAPECTIILQNLSPHTAPSLQMRYLLVPFVFSLILLARYFGAMLRRPSPWRKFCIAILALATLGNGFHLGRFLALGRGDYREGLDYMAANTLSHRITWASNTGGNTFRDAKMMLYYQRFLPGKFVVEPADHPDWLIFNVQDASQPTLPVEFNQGIYCFDSVYPSYGLSGWTWIIYRKQ